MNPEAGLTQPVTANSQSPDPLPAAMREPDLPALEESSMPITDNEGNLQT